MVIILCSQVLWPFNHHLLPLLVPLTLVHMRKHTHIHIYAYMRDCSSKESSEFSLILSWLKQRVGRLLSSGVRGKTQAIWVC